MASVTVKDLKRAFREDDNAFIPSGMAGAMSERSEAARGGKGGGGGGSGGEDGGSGESDKEWWEVDDEEEEYVPLKKRRDQVGPRGLHSSTS